jgi:hypothetical protein
VSPDDVHQVRITHASRTLGDGVLVGPGFVAALRDAGPVVALRAPGSDTPVAAEVVEVLGSEGRVLREVVAPGFDAPGAGRLLADRKLGGADGSEGEGSTADTASGQAGGTRRRANERERGVLLEERRLELTVPALEGSR